MGRSNPAPRKITLPNGELSRFRLPEVTDEDPPAARRRRRGLLRWLTLWLLFTFVCFQWSEGRLGPRQWLESTLSVARDLAAPPPAAETPRVAPGEPAAAAPAPSEGAKDDAVVVARPSLTHAPRPVLPAHTGSLARAPAPLEEVDPTETAPVGIEWEHGERDLQVHAGPGCERAKRRYRETFLDETEDPATVRLLAEKRRYAHCRAELMSLRVCALVHRGEAVGVTVQSEPPNRVVSTCAAIVAKTLHYPVAKRPRLVRTEIVFD